MKNLLIIISFFASSIVLAQGKSVYIDLNPQEIKKKELPFYIKEIHFAKENSDTVALLTGRKKNENIYAVWKKDKELQVLDFINEQYKCDKKGVAINMQIQYLCLVGSEKNKFNFTDTFKVKLIFLRQEEGNWNEIYKFNAKNVFGTFEDPETVLNNYIVRAINTSIENFKNSEAFKKSASTENDANDANKKPIKVLASHNKLNADTIVCTAGNKLTWQDFQVYKNDLSESGSAKFILTYQVGSEETSKHLKLDIHTKAFFNKRNSWKPKESDEKWLQYQQGHYDICAAYGLKLHKAMKNYNYSLGMFKTELNKLYNEIYTEYTHLRKDYETETVSGNDPVAISTWRKKIDKLLQEQK